MNTKDNIEIFGIGQITLENGDTHDVQVITCKARDNSSHEIAYVYEEKRAAHIVHCVNTHDALVEALESLVHVINAAGLHNLSSGVQLGQTSWYFKADNAMKQAATALTLARKEA